MGVESDYKQLAKSLLLSYSKGCLEAAEKTSKKRLSVRQRGDARLIESIKRIQGDMRRYRIEESIEKALEAVNLAKIYERVDQRESNLSSREPDLGYEDCIVLETLRYFKEDFFHWMNKPKCPNCNQDGDNIKALGSERPQRRNTDEISVVEVYCCVDCQRRIFFPRINNPARLLETRSGRCGEWVNCFLLILKAVLGSEVPVRYVWNAEDHVWCEYYSKKQQRWIHLDPCENVYDEPSLYCANWGKKMSWVIGVGDTYVVDLSNKYITVEEKTIRKSTVANEKVVEQFLVIMNSSLLVQYWEDLSTSSLSLDDKYMKLYDDVLLLQARERSAIHPAPSKHNSLPEGRQTGTAEWTTARGESGSGGKM